MKLLVTIPCLNEQENLKKVIKSVPKRIENISEIKILVLDDGSTDNSVEIAKELGALVYSHKSNLGLARTFKHGLEEAIKLGSDLIVNLDADGQYNGEDIPKLIEPILNNTADLVIGNRQIFKLDYLPPQIKFLQKAGSFVVSFLSNKDIPDAPSGFRAITRETALRLNIITYYTYTLETILHAADLGLIIKNVPITANKVDRKSRLMKNKFEYIIRSLITLFRMFTFYNPFKVFATIGSVLLITSFILGVRFLVLGAQGHVQSLILCAILGISGLGIFLAGLIADIMQHNRKLLEEINYKLKLK